MGNLRVLSALFLFSTLLAGPRFALAANTPPSASAAKDAKDAASAADAPAKKENTPSLSCSPLSEKGSPDGDESCTIAIGVIDVRDFDFTPKVQIANESLMQMKEGSNPDQIRLIPIKVGSVSVIIENAAGGPSRKIIYNIIKNDLSSRVTAIRELLFDIEGITVRTVDDKIVVDGELVVPHDLDRIVAVQAAYPDLLNLVTLSKISREAIARRMQKEINDQPGGANVQVRIINDTFFLLGKVDSGADKDRVEVFAKTFLPDIMGSQATKEGVFASTGIKKSPIQDLIETEEQPPPAAPKMFRITYHFVEISKDYLKSSFFKWTPFLSQGAGIQIGSSTTGGTAASGGSSFVGTITNLFPQLQSGSNGGFSRVLFSAVGVGLENDKITINRGDNEPFIGAVVNGVPVPQNAQAGLEVSVTPSIVSEDKIKLATSFTFKAFTGATAAGAPATNQTVLQNSMIVRSGESAVLGGLVSNSLAKDVGRDPSAAAANSGSPLFALLRSKSFRNDKTQFVVFITPKIIDDAAEGTADIKAKIINNTKKRQRELQ